MIKTHSKIEDEHAGKKQPITPVSFVQHAFRIPVDGELSPFSFKGRRYLEPIYNTPSTRLLLKCGRQVEKSTTLGNIALTYLALRHHFRILFVSPTQLQTNTFSRDRLESPINYSEILRSLEAEGKKNKLYKHFKIDSDITLRYAFLHGERIRGIAADMLLLDELQDLIVDVIPVIEEALSHSSYKILKYAGTPKHIDNTIEFYWSKWSTQNEWMIPCDHCGGGDYRYWNQILEENVGPKSLVCGKCKKQIQPDHEEATWVSFCPKPTGTAIPFVGYRIPQPITPWLNWQELIDKKSRYSRAKFHNEVLGLSYDSGEKLLTKAELKPQCRDDLSLSRPLPRRNGDTMYMGIDWGCHDEETRLLTGRGFVYFRDLTDDDVAAQFDPVTRELTFVKPLARTARDWDGELLQFKNRSVDMLLTDTHKMRVGDVRSGKWRDISAGELITKGSAVNFVGGTSWSGVPAETFVLPGVPKSAGYQGTPAKLIPMPLWMEFLGYYLTEGGLCFTKSRKGEPRPSCVKMSQRGSINMPNVIKIRACLDALGIQYSEFYNKETTDYNWTIYGKQLWSWVGREVGALSSLKRIPREFLNLPPDLLKILFDAMVLGDGSRSEVPGEFNGGYYSTSRGLCEDFQEVCIRLGIRSSTRLTAPAEGNRKARWAVSWSTGRDFHFRAPKSTVSKVPYKGKVYCCAVPSGYIVTERNGKIAYQGNSGERAFTVVSIGRYMGDRFTYTYIKRYEGEEAEPRRTMEHIKQLVRQYDVTLIGADYGGGYDRNDELIRSFGVAKVMQYQYVGTSKKIYFDKALNRFMVNRTPVLIDFINGIKRSCFSFFNWAEFEIPFADDMVNIFKEFNESRNATQLNKSPGMPDDTLHSTLYCFLASMVRHPRPDILTPDKDD